MRVDLYSPFSLHEIAKALHCSLPQTEDREIYGVSLSSKSVCQGDLYIALKGQKADGHSFSSEASKHGAVAVLCERDCPCESVNLKVESTLHALGRLASYVCGKHKHKTVAVTGSVGKSSTCAYAACLLGEAFSVHSTKGNYNNEIGVPMTMLSIKEETEILLLEMGMNHAGEIKRLSEYAKPDIAMITNIGTAHIGMLGSKEKIALAKGEITAGLDPTGTLWVPHEEQGLRHLHPHTRTFSLKNSAADVFLSFPKEDQCMAHFSDGGFFSFQAAYRDTVKNETALRAIALAHSFSVSYELIEKGLRSCSLPQGRQSILSAKGRTLIDDSYNASFESMVAAFEKLNSLPCKGKKVALLGDMLEMGEFSQKWHQRVGEAFASYGFDGLFTVGKYGNEILLGARKMGMSTEKMLYMDSQDLSEIAAFLDAILNDGDVLLVKGSHALQLDKVIKLLLKEGE